MGKLALAGALGGAGTGIGKGVENMESGFIQSGLLQQRDEMEARRMQMTFAHNEALADKNIAATQALHATDRQHASDLQAAKIESERGMHQETIGANLTGKGMEINEKQKENEAKNKNEEWKLRNEEQHNKDWKEVYGNLAEARKRVAEGKGTRADHEILKLEGNIVQAQITALRTQEQEIAKDQMMDPGEKKKLLKGINGRITGLAKNYRNDLGLDPLPEAELTSKYITDPLDPDNQLTMGPGSTAAQSATQAGKPAPAAQAGALNTPPPAQAGPSYYPGQDEMEDLKRSIRPKSKYQSGPSAVPPQQ